MCVASRATAYHVYWRILRAAAAAARNLHLRMRCKLPMHDLCVCLYVREREREGVVVCMQMKSGSEASGNTGRIRTQFVAFHNFAHSPEEVKMQKVSAISFCSLLVAFITHAKNVRVGKQCSRGSQRCRAQRGTQRGKGGGKGAMCWVRVVFAGFVCGVCLKFMTV